MKNFYKILSALFLVVFFLNANAQAPRYVEVDGYDLNNPVGSIGDYNNTLWQAIYDDSLGREENPNTIYMLKRDHVYPTGKIISNNFPLFIEGEEGEGFLPEISVGLKADGTTGNDFINAYGDLSLKNIYFNGSEGGGAYLHRMIEMRAPNARFIFDGCAITGDNSGAVVLKADSLKVYVRNSVMGNLGHRFVMNGNGRFIEIRGEAPYVDTLVIENCLTYNQTDRIIRNEGSTLNYVKIDHLTALNTVGRNGGIELGFAKKAIVTNNVLANVISIGHTEAHAAEQQQADHHFAAITLDSIFDGQSVELRNNNIFWDKAVRDAWGLYDTVEAPNYICSTTAKAIGEANMAEAYFDEPLAFKNVSGNLAEYVANYYADPANENLPDSWCVGGEGGLYYDEIDVSYANTYKSFTADDNGEPVGCQLTFELVSSIFSQATKDQLQVACYPNPFVSKATLQFTLTTAAEVNLTIYDITGAEVMNTLNKNLSAGMHELEVSAEKLHSGIYFYKVKAGKNVTSGKMILNK